MENKISRAEKRFKERVAEEAEQVHSRLTKQFFDFFVVHPDPEGKEVEQKVMQVSAQWKIYCRRARLSPVSFDLLDKFMNGLITEYKEMKENKPAANVDPVQ